MTTQTGLALAAAGGSYKLDHTLKRPSPGSKQVLVKSLVVGLNPVDELCRNGALITAYPAVIGAEACGVVIETGPDCVKFQQGDLIYGLVRVGVNDYAPFQETFLADEDLFFKKAHNISKGEAAGVGAGIITAAFGIIEGGQLSIPEVGSKVDPKDEWIIVIGGSGTVGQYAIQLAKLCGYKVLATTSASKVLVAKQMGAAETVNNRSTIDEQLGEIKRITGGSFALVFDASTFGTDLALKALETISTATSKYFSTVDDWSPMDIPSSINVTRPHVGILGREDPDAQRVTRQAAAFTSSLQTHLDSDSIVPVPHRVWGKKGWEGLIEALEYVQYGGNVDKKLAVEVQEE